MDKRARGVNNRLAAGVRIPGGRRPMPSPAPSFRPLYLQIKALLVGSLETGEWRPGEAIPSELELAHRFGKGWYFPNGEIYKP